MCFKSARGLQLHASDDRFRREPRSSVKLYLSERAASTLRTRSLLID